MNKDDNRINCFKCKFFHISWDPVSPRGCKYFGFKSALMPSIVVLQSSGKECGAFTPKDIIEDKK